MIFLNPAVLFGLLAASIPVLIHLLNLRKLKRIDFSTLTFLKELQKSKIRRIKLKQWLLLALRVLLILLLVTAFARPTLQGVAIGGTTSAAKTTAVFILDNTFSMSVVGSNGSYFNRAKGTIKELTGELQEGDEAALVLVGNKSRDEIKATNNIADFIKKVDNTNITYESGTLNNAIIKAANVLSASKNFNKEIYILSDFQKGRLANKNSLSELGNILSKNVRIYGFDYAGKDVFNIGISGIEINTQIFEKDKPVNFSVTITNYSKQPVENNVVSLFINGERYAQQSVSLQPGDSKLVNIESPVKKSGYQDVFAQIEDDDIMQDNKRYANFFVANEIPVIVFSDNNSDTKFAEAAMTALNTSGETIKITNRNSSQLSSMDLSKFEVVVLIGSGNLTGTDRLKSYIENGGSLFLMPGSSSTLQGFQNITKALGLPSPSSAVGKQGSTENPVAFDKIDFNNPIFQNIFSANEKKNIESPEIYYHFYQKTEGRGNDIISLVDGSAFLSSYVKGKGKVFLLNAAPVLSWSDFPIKSIFAPLINKSIFYLASKDRTDAQTIAGDILNINVSEAGTPRLKIISPDKVENYINLEKAGGSNYVKYSNTGTAGNYKIYSGDNLIDEYSVNPDPRESVTEYLSEDDFKDYLNKIDFKGRYINVNIAEDPARVVLQSRFGSELWRYFILAAIIIALIEMTVARNVKKELAEV